jgi:hypothetical protein
VSLIAKIQAIGKKTPLLLKVLGEHKQDEEIASNILQIFSQIMNDVCSCLLILFDFLFYFIIIFILFYFYIVFIYFIHSLVDARICVR